MLQLPRSARALRWFAILGVSFAAAAAEVFGQGTAYVASFEAADGYTTGPFVTQGRWTLVQGTANVVTTDKVSGIQSLLLASGSTVRADVSGTSTAHVVFVDLFVRPSASTDATTTTMVSTDQVAVRFVRENDSATLYYRDGDGAGNGTWKSAGVSVPVGADGKATEWVRLSLREDYTAHRSDLYVRGSLVACRIGALDNTQADLHSVTIAGGAGADTGVDDVYAGPDNPLFTDTNRNGIDDAWETRWNLSLANNNRDDDPDGDGATNLEEFMRGTDPVTGTHTLTLSNPQTAGIAGFRPLWDTPIALAELPITASNTVGPVHYTVAEPGRHDYGVAPTVYWQSGPNRTDMTAPAGLVFDAVHRNILVRFPTASQQIAAEVKRGFRIKKVELQLQLNDSGPDTDPIDPTGGTHVRKGTEFWPEYYRPVSGLSFLGQAWLNTAPRWHAVAWFLRKPWANDAANGPTFNANINGASYWEKYGAQGASDRFPFSLATEVSSANPDGRVDLTAAIASAAGGLGGTLSDRLDILNNQGLLIKKQEVYDFLYWQGGYEYATEVGQRGVLIRTPKLIVQFEPAAIPEAVDAKPALDLASEISRVQQAGSGGSPTAVVPSPDQFAQLSSRLGLVQPAWMPAWQWQRLQELNALPTANGFVEDVATEFPATYPDYLAWIDSMLSIEPRRWAGFDAGKKAAIYLRYQSAFPGPLKDHWGLYWWSWLMPDRPWLNPDGSHNFVQAVTEVDKGRAYYNLTRDWRGDASVYRSYVHDLGPQDFNYWAAAGVMLGGSIVGSNDMIAEGRAGFESYPIRTWSWADGSTQESIDHYYFAITLGATKPFADYGPTAYDRLLGKLALTKSVEELATHYHPALRRFISTSGRTGPGYVLGIQDGLQYIVHTLSPSGALTDQGQTTVAGIGVLGHDVLPSEAAMLSLDSSWAPEWYTNLVDPKSLPFQSKLIGSGVLKTSYLGHDYGLASGIGASGTIPFLAQWRRVEAQPSSLRDIGTLLLRYGINRTEFLDTIMHGGTTANGNGIVGNQGGYIQPVQYRNKAIVFATPTANLVTDGARTVPSTISSLQTSVGFYNFELAPGWQLFVDGQPVTSFPISVRNTQRITIRDGVSYLAILPLPATDLGRTDQVVISTDGVATTLQGGGTAKEAIRIDNYNFKAGTAVTLSALNSAQLDAAWGGYVVEIGDATEFGSFDAFQQHIAAATIGVNPSADGKSVDLSYTSGSDTIAATFNTTGGGSVTNPMANGATLGLAPNIVRDTDVSIQGTGGILKKNGATLLTDAKAMAFLQVEPISGTYMGVNGRPDLSKFVLTAPGGVVVRTEGKVGAFRAAVCPAQNKIWIDSGGIDGSATGGRAALVSGLSAHPTIVLDGVMLTEDRAIALPTAAGPLYVIPLNGQVDASLLHDYADTDGNGLPDAWEMKWFHQLGTSVTDDPDGDGIDNAHEFVAGTNPVLSDAWIKKYLGNIDDDPYQDPGNTGRTFLQSFRDGGRSPWPDAVVPDGLRLWYRGDLGVSANSAYYDQLYQWTDLSGSGFHMSASPNITAPFWQGSFNGHRAVFCQGWWSQLTTDGACDVLQASNDVTMVAVIQPDPTQYGHGNVFDLGDPASGYFGYGIFGDSDNRYTMRWPDSTSAVRTTASAFVSPAGPQILIGIKNGANADLFVNGQPAGTVSIPSPADIRPVPAKMAIGNGTYQYYGYNGTVAEIRVYNRALNATERQQLEADLEQRYLSADSDNDGLPDAWEMQYFGTLAYGPTDDPGNVGRHLIDSYTTHANPWPDATVGNGLRAWYRAEFGATKDSNNRVSALADLSGNGFHLLQIATASEPLSIAGAANGKPVLQFNGSNVLGTKLPVDLRAGSDDFTVIAVAVPQTPQDGQANLVCLGQTKDGYSAYGLQGNSFNQYLLGWHDGTSPVANTTVGRVQIVTGIKAGTAATIFVNGTNFGSSNVPQTVTDPIGIAAIGASAFATTFAAHGYNGQIAEVLIYNRALSETERTAIEQELVHRYISDDSDHDGLPDAWEQQYLGTLAYGAGDDPGNVHRTLLESYTQQLSPWPDAPVAAGLQAWYKAGVGALADNTGKVSVLSDLTGHGFHLAQTAPSSQPLWVPGAANGNPVLQFNGGMQLCTQTAMDIRAGSNDVTVVAVVIPSTQSGPANVVCLGSEGDGYGAYGLQGNGSNQYLLGWHDGASPYATALAGNVQILTGIKQGTNATIFLNGTSAGSKTVPLTITNAPGVVAVGASAYRFTQGSYGFNGQIAEVMIFNRALSTDERQKIEAGLAAPYIATDSDHDGLPDAWEMQYFGTLIYGPNDDPGGTGKTLANALRDGSNPWGDAVVPTGLRMWYRAGSGAIKDASNKVSLLPDLSGNGAHLRQTISATRQPTWLPAGMSGQPSLRFDGSNVLATNLPFDVRAGSNDVTIVAVMAPDALQSAPANVVYLGDTTDGYTASGIQGTNANQYFMGWRNGQTPAVTLRAANTQLITTIKSGTTATTFLNGVSAGSRTVEDTIYSAVGKPSIGAASWPSYYYRGQIAEVLVYNRALSETERQQIEESLGKKYGTSNQIATYPGTYALAGQLAFNQEESTPVMMTDGRIMYAAGTGHPQYYRNEFWPMNNAQIYDPDTGTTTVTGSLRQGRVGAAVAALPDGRVMVLGGNNFEGSIAGTVSDIEIWDPKTGAFSYGGSTAYSRIEATPTVLLDGRVLITGGETYADWPWDQGWLYDPKAKAITLWVKMAARKNLSAVRMLDGRVLVAGGYDVYRTPQRTLEIFDPATNTVTGLGPLHEARVSPKMLALRDGRTLIWGGGGSTLEMFDPTTNSITKWYAFSDNTWGIQLADDQVYFGATGRLFNATTGTFTSAVSPIIPRWDAFAFNLPDGRIAITGGSWYNISFEIRCEVYTPNNWAPLPTVRPGLRAWYRAGAGVVKDATGKVSQWSDVSGHGANTVQNNATWQPSVVTNSSTGQPAVAFNGSQFVQTPAAVDTMGGSTDFSTFAVVQLAANQPANESTIFDTDFQTGNGYKLYSHDGGLVQTIWVSNAWFGSMPVTVLLDTPQLLGIVKNGTSVKAYLNGQLIWSTELTGSLVGMDPSIFSIGSSRDGGASLNGQISEILLYNRAVTDAERQKIEAACINRYGLADTDHDGLPDAWEMQYLGTLAYNGGSNPFGTGTLQTAYNNHASPLPAAIVPAGLRAWLCTDFGLTKDSKGKVSEWLDMSGHGLNVVQSNAAAQPTVVTNNSTGQPAVAFDGTQFLQTTAAVDSTGGSTDFTTMAVIQIGANQTSAFPNVFDTDYRTGNGLHLYLHDRTQLQTMWVTTVGGWWGSTPVTVLPDTPQLVEIVKSGTLVKAYLNGQLIWSTPLDSAALGTAPGSFSIGALRDGADALNGQISELLLYNRALTDAERQQIEASWTAKYNLADTDRDGLPDAWEMQYFGTLAYDGNSNPFGTITLQQAYSTHVSPLPAALVSNGLRGWFKPDAGVTKDANSKISQWLDLSGHGMNVVQPNAAQQPTVVTNSSTGQPAVAFDGTQFLQTNAAVDSTGGSTDFTTLAVVQIAANQPSYTSNIFDTDYRTGNGYRLYSQNGGHVQALWVTNVGGWWGSTPMVVLPDTPQLVELVKSGTSMKAYLNGQLIWSTPLGSPVLGTAPGSFSIGALRYGGDPFAGQISELLLYNRALTDAERQQLEASWIAKYHLADTDHDGLPDAWEMQYLGTLAYDGSSNPFGTITLQQAYDTHVSPLPAALIPDGLRGWFRPDIGVTTDAAGKITQWLDLSGHGLNVAQSNPAQQPTVVTNNSTGHLAAAFDGASFLQTNAAVDTTGGSTDFTTFAVIQVAGTQPTNASAIFDTDFHSGNGYQLYTHDGGRVQTLWVSSAGWFGSVPMNVLADVPQLVEIVKRGTSVKAYLKGQLIWSTEAGSPLIGTDRTAFTIGAARDGGSPLNGQISEILMYNRALTDAERQQLEAACIARYGLADIDHDGLPDAWELQYLGTLAYDGQSDPLHTGALLQSYNAQRSPLPATVFPSGLRAWFRPDTGVIRDANGKVSEWVDASGHGINATQLDPGQRPAVVTDSTTGQQAVAFNGSAFLQTNGTVDVMGGSTDFATFALVQVARTQPYGWPVLFDTDFHSGNGFQLYAHDAQVQTLWVSTAGWFGSVPVPVSPDTPQLVEVLKSGTSVKTFINGQLISSTEVGSPAMGTDPCAFSIGASRDGGQPFNGRISEVLLFNRGLSDQERTAVETALRMKYLVNITDISPQQMPRGGAAFSLVVNGDGFLSGSTVQWNGAARPTTFVSSKRLSASIAAADIAAADLTTAIVTVRNPNGDVTNAKSFAITPPTVGVVQTNVSMLNTSATATTAPSASGDAGVTTTIVNATNPTVPVAVTVANYATNPTPVPVFDVGGKFVDVQVTGAHTTDQATSYFYYPNSITGQAEQDLVLKYFNGTDWIQVLSSGGVAPDKNTTDNLDGTTSGGRFAAIFDGTSTPKVTELTGTVFTVGPKQIPVQITLSNLAPTYDGTPKAPLVTTAPSGVLVDLTYNGSPTAPTKVGAYNVSATVHDLSHYIGQASATLQIVDRTPPVIAMPGNLTIEATSAAGARVPFTVTATDDVDGKVAVDLSAASGGVFPLGTTTVKASAKDAAGNTAKAEFTITVRDTTAPAITTLAASPATLWPVDQKLKSVTIAASATDAVGVVSLKIVAVSSNEPISGTAWQITGPLAVDLLADRQGKLADRIYTITVEARDAAGNSSTRIVTVTVPHDQGKS